MFVKRKRENNILFTSHQNLTEKTAYLQDLDESFKEKIGE
jgi:hypothetical protein